MTHRIRELDEKDLAAATQVIRRSFATVAEEFRLTRQNCPGNGAFISEETLRNLRARGVRMFGLEVSSELVGFIAVKQKDVEVWYLEKACVLPHYRRRGYGAALLRHGLRHIREQGGRRISIGIIAAHTELKRWYERHGFTVVGNRRFASLPFIVCYMEKLLPE